jgi:hypothetical protein
LPAALAAGAPPIVSPAAPAPTAPKKRRRFDLIANSFGNLARSVCLTATPGYATSVLVVVEADPLLEGC